MEDEIQGFLDSINSEDFTGAQETFAQMMQDRISSALDQKKIAVADAMYNNAEEEDDFDDEEIDDEELASILDEYDLDEEDFEDED